jgi:indole-3-glycerol phosphate synthase
MIQLQEIIDRKAVEVKMLKELTTQEMLLKQIKGNDPVRPFLALFQPDKINEIAEAKKASPSKGLIRKDFQVKEIASAYYHAGARAISCLTERYYFQGHPDFVALIRQTCPLPVLRKDFIMDPWQLYESRAIGADAVLLIVAVLGRERLAEMMSIATSLKLTCLVEVHDEEELQIALDADATLVGINNRNLKTMVVDLETSFRLLPGIPDHVSVVIESGIHSQEDVHRFVKAGARNFLVGEALMKSDDIMTAFTSLFT